jgi:hypothetical protein
LSAVDVSEANVQTDDGEALKDTGSPDVATDPRVLVDVENNAVDKLSAEILCASTNVTGSERSDVTPAPAILVAFALNLYSVL